MSGAHTTKFGVDYQRIAGLGSLQSECRWNLHVQQPDRYLANHTPALYTQFTGSGSVNLTIHEIAGYVQDEWRILPGVTINPGFRYEAQLNPNYYPATAPASRYPGATSIPDDTTMFAPRLGVAWDVGNAGKTVIRAGGGLYYAPTYMSMFAQSVLFNGGNPDRAYSVSMQPASPQCDSKRLLKVSALTWRPAPLTNLPTFTPSQFAALQASWHRAQRRQLHGRRTSAIRTRCSGRSAASTRSPGASPFRRTSPTSTRTALRANGIRTCPLPCLARLSQRRAHNAVSRPEPLQSVSPAKSGSSESPPSPNPRTIRCIAASPRR